MSRYRSTWGFVCHFVMYAVVFLTACRQSNDRAEDLSAFYLPADSLEGAGMEYAYQSLSDTTLPLEIWHHRRTSDNLITSINYDPAMEVVQKQYERMVSNGVLIDSLILYFSDSPGRRVAQQVRVLSPHRFPFDATDSTMVWLTHLEWWQPDDSLHIVLQRRRRFLGKTEWNWKNKKVDAVRFRTVDSFETEKDGWTTSEWKGEEVYARGIGLIYYRRDISADMRLEFELVKRSRIE